MGMNICTYKAGPNSRKSATVICILFCTINLREHYLVVLQFDIFGQ